jgi:hypothetical protein
MLENYDHKTFIAQATDRPKSKQSELLHDEILS